MYNHLLSGTSDIWYICNMECNIYQTTTIGGLSIYQVVNHRKGFMDVTTETNTITKYTFLFLSQLLEMP